MDNMTLPTLYKTSAKGVTQIINMEIIGDAYTRTWGQLGGKQQSKATVAKPKNVGRSNETTAEQQAILEAEAVWTKKQKANYSTSQEAPTTVNLPMKVNTYQKHKKKVVFPCYTSVKLNGVNAEYRLVGGELKLLSRGGEQYPIPAHQRNSVITLLKHIETGSINGEMYIHGEHLQDIMAATKKHNELTPSLIFYAFDFPTIEGDYATRCGTTYKKVVDGAFNAPGIEFVNVGVARSHEELDLQHKQATDAGYEGIIIRNATGLYKYNTRSLDVFKYKLAQDAEFEIIKVSSDKNGHPVMTFRSSGGEFKAKPKGTNEERLQMMKYASEYVGKWATVEYEMLSKGYNGLPGVPLKPVMICLRECDTEGSPKV